MAKENKDTDPSESPSRRSSESGLLRPSRNIRRQKHIHRFGWKRQGAKCTGTGIDMGTTLGAGRRVKL